MLVEVNPNMYRTYGRSFIRVEDIDYFVPSNKPPIQNPPLAIGEVEKQIVSMWQAYTVPDTIAHPDFRKEIWDEAKGLYFI